jgi:hypothetical protein
VCQSWKKNPNTSSQWAIPHDKNITLKKEKRKKGKKKKKKETSQIAMSFVHCRDFDKSFDSKMSHIPCI